MGRSAGSGAISIGFVITGGGAWLVKGAGSGAIGVLKTGACATVWMARASAARRDSAVSADEASAAPHPLQNLAMGAFSVPHFKHFKVLTFAAGPGAAGTAARALQSAPHALQNLAVSELRALHFGQFIGLGSPDIRMARSVKVHGAHESGSWDSTRLLLLSLRGPEYCIAVTKYLKPIRDLVAVAQLLIRPCKALVLT